MEENVDVQPVQGSSFLNTVGSGLITGIGTSAFQTAISALLAKRNSDLQYQANSKLAKESYDRQIEFWNMQNAYNTPAAQMRRLQEAGLNPAMLNGVSAQNTAGNLSSVPHAQIGMPSASAPDSPLQGIATLSNLAYMLKQSGLIDAETKNWLQATANKELEGILMKLTGKDHWLKIKDEAAAMGYDIPDADYYDELFGVGAEPSPDGRSPAVLSMDQTQADIDERGANKEYTQTLKDIADYLKEIQKEEIQQNIAESQQRVKTLEAEEKKMLADRNLADQLYQRQRIVDAGSAFFGFRVDELPPLLQMEVMDLYQQVVNGDIYPETALRSVLRLANDFREKEVHIPRTRSSSVSQSKGRSAGFSGSSSNTSSTTSWLETY